MISLNSQATRSIRELARMPKITVDKSPKIRTQPRDVESLTKSITKTREDVQEAHNSNKDEDQRDSKTKKTSFIDTFIRQTKKFSTQS